MPGNGIVNIQKDSEPDVSTLSLSEIVLYCTIFFPTIYFGGIRLTTVLFLQSILLSAYFIDRFRFRGRTQTVRIDAPYFFLILFIFSFWICIRGLQPDYFYRGLTASQIYMTALFVFLMALSLPDSQVRRLRMLIVLLAGSFFLALTHFFISYLNIDPRSPSIYYFFHGYHYHGYATLMIALGLGLQMVVRGPAVSFILLIQNIVLTLSILYYRKAGGIIAFLAILVIFIYFFSFKVKIVKKLTPLVIILLILLNILVFAGMGSITQELSQSLSFTQGALNKRNTYIFQGTFEMIRDHLLFGVGTGKFSYAFPSYRNPQIDATPRFTHSEPLQLLAETGLIGLLLAITLLYSFIRSLHTPHYHHQHTQKRHIRRHMSIKTRVDHALTMGTRAGLIGFGIICLTDFELHIPANAFLFAYLAGELLLLESKKTVDTPTKTSSYLRSYSRFVAKPFILFSLIFIIFIHNGFLVSSSYFVRQGKELKIQNEEKAVASLAEAIRAYPLDPEPYTERAQIFLGWGTDWVVKAAHDLDIALVLAPGEGMQVYLRGLCAENMRGFSEAHLYYKRALELDPNNVLYLFRQGRLFYQQDKKEQAYKNFIKIVDSNGQLFPAILDFLVQSGEKAASLEFLVPRDEPKQQLLFGKTLLASGEQLEAMRFFDQLIERKVVDGVVLYDMFQTWSRLVRNDEYGFRILTALINHPDFNPSDPKHLHALEQYVAYQLRHGQGAHLESMLETLIEQNPNIPSLWIFLSQIRLSISGEEAQLKTLEQALSRYEYAAELYEQLGLIAYKNHDYLEAIDNFRTACQKSPRNKRYYLQLVNIYMKRGMHLQARIALEEILAKYPDDISLLSRLRLIYEQTSLSRDELEVIEHILRIKPNDPVSLKRKELLESNQ
ncbi:O-antigen ligase family protein [bacterium]|nr:O-antigen ligase family protein [bacterium]